MATALTLEEIIGRFRIDNDDIWEPYHWSDADITRYIAEAQDVICDAVNIFPDEVSVSYTADDPWVDRPEYITQVRGVFSTTDEISLRALE